MCRALVCPRVNVKIVKENGATGGKSFTVAQPMLSGLWIKGERSVICKNVTM